MLSVTILQKPQEFFVLFVSTLVLRGLAVPALGPAVRGEGTATHPEAPRVQHLGVAGKVHLQGSVIADSHRHFLQGLVPTM